MAGLGGKTYPLSIVVGTVDNATKQFERINREINRLTAPVRRLNNRLGALKEASGLGESVKRFKEAGHGLAEFGHAAKENVVRLLELGAVAGVGAGEVIHLINETNELARTADRLGLSVDAYASLRDAAKDAGVGHEELDAAMAKFSLNVQKAKMGTGELAGLLGKVSPALLKQVKSTKSSEEAFLLMADAVQKVKDPAKQALLATAAFGRGAAPLVALLKKGSEGVKEAQAEYLKLAGSQEEAARVAQEAFRAFDSVNDSMDSVKATIITALGPALSAIAKDVTSFLTSHRAQFAQWAGEFGKRLPAAVEEARRAVMVIFNAAGWLWNKIGGLNGVLTVMGVIVGVKAVIAIGAMARAVAGLTLSLAEIGIVALFNPIGQFLILLGAITAAVISIVQNWDEFKYAGRVAIEFVSEAWTSAGEWISKTWTGILDAIGVKIDQVVGLAGKIKDFFDWSGQASGSRVEGGPIIARHGGGTGAAALGGPGLPADITGTGQGGTALANPVSPIGQQTSEAHVTVDFANMPKGARATTDPRDTADLDLSVGYQLAPG